ncbi:MAG: H-NS histone family protein [Curvibacter sp.]|nr:H-NS histone family protein [Curvibacter sp.]
MSPLFSEIHELDRQLAELKAQRDEWLTQKRADALVLARHLVERFGLTAAQLQFPVETPAARPPSPPRPVTFRDPARGLSWNGEWPSRGRKPAWIQAAIDDGSIEQYRVGRPAGEAAPAPVRPKSKAEMARELGLIY